jgi:hypothetical protein
VAEPLIQDELDAPGPAAQPRRSKRFRGRFLVVYLLLGLVLGAAIAGLVVLLAKPGAEPPVQWSAWKPDGDESQMTQEIAQYVGGRYHLQGGQQLVGVQSTPLRIQDVPIGAIAIRRLPESGASQTPVDVFEPGNSAVYILCGFGPDCAIQEGSPSEERLRLLRREALELALYTFRYVDEKSSVVVFLPPKLGDKATYALFFRRGDFETQLDAPLSATLSAPTPPLPEQIAPSEVATIDELTGPTFFRFQFQQLQDGTAVLVLDDPRLPAPETAPTGQGDTQTQPATTQDQAPE